MEITLQTGKFRRLLGKEVDEAIFSLRVCSPIRTTSPRNLSVQYRPHSQSATCHQYGQD